MKTFTVASLFTSAFAALPAHTEFTKLSFYAGSATCADATLSSKVTVIDKCFPTSASSSQKFSVVSATALSTNVYGTADCTGTNGVTFPMTLDTCVDMTAAFGSANGMKAGTAWVPDSNDFVYGYYSDSGCTARTGLTAGGLFSHAVDVSPGECVANKPVAGYSTAIEYSSASMSVKIYAGTTTCATSVTPLEVQGVPGTCKAVPQTVGALLQGAGDCTSASACFIYVFPLGATGPSSSASSSTVAAMAVVAAAGTAALLL